jgi:hypothetical protein
LGALGARHYEYRIADTNSWEDVSYETMIGAWNKNVFGSGEQLPAGVCRHVAALQAATANELGLEGFVVSYQAGRSIHSNVMVREKESGSEAYLINYGSSVRKEGLDGGRLLSQSALDGDNATVYYISSADASTQKEPSVAVITGEKLKLDTELLGDVRELEPMARPSSLVASEFYMGKYLVRPFIGEDFNGRRYGGVATSMNWGDARSSGSVGLVTAVQSTPEGMHSSAEHAPVFLDTHLQLRQRFDHELLQLSVAEHQEVLLKIDALALAMGGASTYLNPRDGDEKGRVGAELPLGGANFGAQAELNTSADRVYAKLRAETHLRVGSEDVSDQTLAVFHNLSTVSADLQGRMGLHQVMAETLFMFDSFGPKAQVGVGYGYDRFSVKAQVSGRLNEEDATLREGSIRTGSLMLQQGASVGDWADLNLYFGASAPLEKVRNEETGEKELELQQIRFSGGLGGRF